MGRSKQHRISFPETKDWVRIARLDILDWQSRAKGRSVKPEDIAKATGLSVERLRNEPPKIPKVGLTDYYIAQILKLNQPRVDRVRDDLPAFTKAAVKFVDELPKGYRAGLFDIKKQLADRRNVAAELYKKRLWDLAEKQLICGLRLGDSVTVEIGKKSYTKNRIEKDADMFRRMKELVRRTLDGDPRLRSALDLGLPARAAQDLDSTMLKGERTFNIPVLEEGEIVYRDVVTTLPAEFCIATPDEFDELQLLKPGKKLGRTKFGSKWKITVDGAHSVEDYQVLPTVPVILMARTHWGASPQEIVEIVRNLTRIELSKKIVQNVLEDVKYRGFAPELWDAAQQVKADYFERPQRARAELLRLLEESETSGRGLRELARSVKRPATTVDHDLRVLAKEAIIIKGPGHRGKWYSTRFAPKELHKVPQTLLEIAA